MTRRPDVDLVPAVESLVACCGWSVETSPLIGHPEIMESAASVALDATVDFLLDSFRLLAGPPENTIYISTPITSGLLYFQQTGVSPREANRANAARVAREAREGAPDRSFIDPTPLVDIPGWSQYEYHVFWTRIIERYSKTILFVDGWQYSAGCSVEFVAGVKLDLRLLAQDLSLISPSQGLNALRSAESSLPSESSSIKIVRASIEELAGLVEGGAA